MKRFLKKIFTKETPAIKIGKYKVFGNSLIVDCEIGDYSYISHNTMIKHTTIGKFCSIATNCVIGEGDHPYKFMSTSPIFYHNGNIFGEIWTEKDYFEIYKRTIIGNDVWIGSDVFIKSGVKIGNGAVIAAGAVVIKDVGDYEIVGGIPAKLIKYRFSKELVDLLSKSKWWDWDIQKLKKNQIRFVSENENELKQFLLKHE